MSATKKHYLPNGKEYKGAPSAKDFKDAAKTAKKSK